MARIIEITGPPGAGKSTIHRAMNKKWSARKSWVPYKKVLPYESFSISKPFQNGLNLLYLLKYGKPSLSQSKLENAGKRFIEQNPEYVEAFWQEISDNNSEQIIKRFKRANTFYEIIQKIQYLKDLKIDKYVIVDEGLVHRLPVVQSIHDKDAYRLDNFLIHTPLPNALIFIDTEVETIISRLKNRKKEIPLHKGLNENELKDLTLKIKERMNYAINKLDKSGMPVLYINSGVSIDSNINSINSFIDNLKA